jgi:pre-rRNA-processing protein TSR1
MSIVSYDDNDQNSITSRAQASEDYLSSGQLIRLTIEISKEDAVVIEDFYKAHCCCFLFSLLRHENKLSVLHFNIQRCEGYDEPIKAKDELLFHVGFRKYWTKPIFSELNLNCDKHRSERFLRVSLYLCTSSWLS